MDTSCIRVILWAVYPELASGFCPTGHKIMQQRTHRARSVAGGGVGHVRLIVGLLRAALDLGCAPEIDTFEPALLARLGRLAAWTEGNYAAICCSSSTTLKSLDYYLLVVFPAESDDISPEGLRWWLTGPCCFLRLAAFNIHRACQARPGKRETVLLKAHISACVEAQRRVKLFEAELLAGREVRHVLARIFCWAALPYIQLAGRQVPYSVLLQGMEHFLQPKLLMELLTALLQR